ncbi:hypothetical protein KBA39_00480 [Myxococcota bacterium]|nr:hypothetical protein [Myxococcota bacterium]HOD06584.1 hypothetical protein [Myxococcota bacterium]
MNITARWFPVFLAGLVACSANGVDEDVHDSTAGDVTGTDVETDDSATTGPVCLGGLPTLEFVDVAITSAVVDECDAPGVSGMPVPVPWEQGGWLIQTFPNTGCTDIDTVRLVWLKPDGSTTVLLRETVSMMSWTSTYPRLFTVLADGFITVHSDCTAQDCEGFPDYPPGEVTLTRRDTDGTVQWELSNEELLHASRIKLLSVTEDGGILVATNRPDGLEPPVNRLVKIKPDGAIDSDWTIPVAGTLNAFLPDATGFLMVFTDGTTMTAIHMTADGTAGTPTTVFTRGEYGSDETNSTFKSTALKTGIVTEMREMKSQTGERLSYGIAFVNADGTVKWRDPELWPDPAETGVHFLHERADGGIEIVDYDLTMYGLISPDSTAFTSSLIPAGNPLGDGREWLFQDSRFLDDGILFMAAINAEPGYYDAVVAMYEPGFEAIRWAKRYRESCSDTPRLVSSGHGWMVYCARNVEWPAGDQMYAPMSGQAGTYLYFDDICD